MTLPIVKPQLGVTGWHTNYWAIVDILNGIDERIRDVVAAALVAGTGLTMSINDSGDTITLNSTAVADIESTVDAVASALTAGPNVTLTYDDAAGTITIGSTGSGAGSTALYSRGVNVAGGEFAADAAHLPGTYSTDYSYDDASAFTALAARGHKLIRLPFRWERIQPTRAAALSPTELTRLQGVVANINAAGMTAVLDVHNYARYIVSGGAEQVLGDGTLTQAHLVDLWTRLSTAFKSNDKVCYGLMNEPHDCVGVSGVYAGTTRYDWNAATVAGWTGDTATASNVASKLRLTKVATAGSFNMRKDDAGAVAGGTTPTGNVIRFEATLVTTPGGTWTAKAQWQNASFAWVNPTTVKYTRVTGGAVETGLVVGVPVYVTCTFASITSPPNAFCLEIASGNATAGTVTVDIDNFSQGSAPGATTGVQVWEAATQACVNAIRANGDTNQIYVPGYGYSGAQVWLTNHPAPWITDSANNFIYEAHYYCDGDNSGVYASSYATENAAAITGGYASLAAKTKAQVESWTSWLSANGVKGFLGEFGWPNNADTASWNAVGEAIYDALDVSGCDATYWSAGARWGTGYILSAYTGVAQDVVKAPATIIEAHPTAVSSGSDLTALEGRVTALESGGATYTNEQAVDAAAAAFAAGAHTGISFTYNDPAGSITAVVTGGTGGGPQGSPGLVWRGIWSGATTYGTNDAVSYNGSSFITTAGVTGTTPGTSAAPNSPWQVLAAGA